MPREDWPETEMAPAPWIAGLRRDGRSLDAIAAMGSALPRFEAIAWAASVLAPLCDHEKAAPARRQLMAAAQRWIDEPTDDHRRSIFALAEAGDDDWPETLLGYAIFFSGGSIAPEDIDPVQPDPSTAGRLAAGAVQAAAIAQGQPQRVLTSALDLAEKVAVSGTKALENR
ncbi:MAG TPA: hypothetical protein PKD99_10005 [Sphingopyxis sp.]|nr:hypothetical protein [Sphingopyxis sp.]